MKLTPTPVCWMLLVLIGLSPLQTPVACQETASPDEAKEAQGFPPPPGLTRLAKEADVWIDFKRKWVIVDGEIALTRGQLEMFACPKGTKEHESVVAVHSKAQYVHAALLAVGAKKGRPVQFEPEYAPASGTTIEVTVLWTDEQGENHKVRAQQWIRNTETGEEMQYDWVFGGSGFWKDPTDGKEYYYGDSGDFICVSNFPSATLDLPVESSQANSSLLFEAYEKRIPPRGTKVRLVLRPRPPKKQDDEKDEKKEDQKKDTPGE